MSKNNSEIGRSYKRAGNILLAIAGAGMLGSLMTSFPGFATTADPSLPLAFAITAIGFYFAATLFRFSIPKWMKGYRDADRELEPGQWSNPRDAKYWQLTFRFQANQDFLDSIGSNLSLSILLTAALTGSFGALNTIGSLAVAGLGLAVMIATMVTSSSMRKGTRNKVKSELARLNLA